MSECTCDDFCDDPCPVHRLEREESAEPPIPVKLPRWEDLDAIRQIRLRQYFREDEAAFGQTIHRYAFQGDFGEKARKLVGEHYEILRKALLKEFAPLELEMRVARHREMMKEEKKVRDAEEKPDIPGGLSDKRWVVRFHSAVTPGVNYCYVKQQLLLNNKPFPMFYTHKLENALYFPHKESAETVAAMMRDQRIDSAEAFEVTLGVGLAAQKEEKSAASAKNFIILYTTPNLEAPRGEKIYFRCMEGGRAVGVYTRENATVFTEWDSKWQAQVLAAQGYKNITIHRKVDDLVVYRELHDQDH